jgi:hypothetical protein
VIACRRSAQLCSLLLALATASACAKPIQRATLTLEQHSLRMQLHVGKDGTIQLAEQPPLTGRVDISPILQAEGIPLAKRPATVQGMIHYGRLYLVADGFHALWEITPHPGSTAALYRAVPISKGQTRAALRNVRLSRYGSSGSSCLRIDRPEADPVFLTARGTLAHDCP